MFALEFSELHPIVLAPDNPDYIREKSSYVSLKNLLFFPIAHTYTSITNSQIYHRMEKLSYPLLYFISKSLKSCSKKIKALVF
jgi:hypothetical protein